MNPLNSNLVFLKLGGSLITDKDRPSTARFAIIERLAGEIRAAMREKPTMRLVLGHGSGSFGHAAASKHQTQNGVQSPAEWDGFVEVWRQAAALNRIVVETLHHAGLPAITFSPSAGAITRSRKTQRWDTTPIQSALQAGLLPVVHGDVVFDETLGGTILSTEMVFGWLAKALQPQKILVSGIEEGVWADYPACTRLVAEITPANLAKIRAAIGGSSSVDVTGGMASKVDEMLSLARLVPGLDILIFSGLQPGNVHNALLGQTLGTRIHD